MPAPILQSLIRTYFLQTGLEVLFDKIQLSLKRPSGIFMGELKPGIQFRMAVYCGGMEMYDITILRFLEKQYVREVELTYTLTLHGMKYRANFIPHLLEFYI